MYDVAIIGAGTAGLSALREVRKATDNFVIINDGPYGTTCARVGCMPSKALIESANAFHRRKQLQELGVHGAEALHADIPAVLRRVRALRDRFVAGTLRITDELGERSIAGRARFVSREEIDVDGRRIRAQRIIIAAGSRPILPPSWAELGSRVLTSDTLFEQQSLPASMAVVGLGVIGCEIAQALSRLGVAVTAFGAGDAVAGLQDPEVVRCAVTLLNAEFPLHLGARAELSACEGRIRIRAADQSVLVDCVMAALGRRPNVENLGLDRIGVPLDENGMPPFDRTSVQISGTRIYFAGDVNGQWPVLHEANDDGYISGYNAPLAEHECFQRRTPLAVVFTDPNIAVVGQRYRELDLAKTAIAGVDFADQGRARIAAENRGVLRIYAHRRDGLLLGAEMCAPRGEHLAHLLALAISRRMTVHDMLRTPFYHPVFEEGLRTALRRCSRQLEVAPASDLANCEAIGATALD